MLKKGNLPSQKREKQVSDQLSGTAGIMGGPGKGGDFILHLVLLFFCDQSFGVQDMVEIQKPYFSCHSFPHGFCLFGGTGSIGHRIPPEL